MGISTVPVGWEDVQDEPGCAYILDECESRRTLRRPAKGCLALLPGASCALSCRQWQRGRS